jgi:hypothetical protein
MWAALRTHWDYFALAFLLGLYVTAALAVIALMLTDSDSDSPSQFTRSIRAIEVPLISRPDSF